MAQFWLTYQELADIFGGTAAEARAGSIANRWSRLKDRSGITHVRLPPPMVARYLETLALMNDRCGDSAEGRIRSHDLRVIDVTPPIAMAAEPLAAGSQG